MTKSLKIDKLFLTSVILLTVAGFFVFTSASLGLLARDGASFEMVALKQAIGLMIGIAAFFIMSKIHYKKMRKNALYILLFAIGLNLLLFIPGLSMYHGGATRWIDLHFITFQPSEFLKIAFIIYFAAWLSGLKGKIDEFKWSALPYLAIIGLLSLLLFFQKDTDTLLVIAGTGFIMLFAAGGRVRHLIAISFTMLVMLSAYVYIQPHARERIVTYLDRSADAQSSSYQIRQSLIAIGSGRLAGRGFGQSVQKFDYLPEPIGDSIFAVGAEEFGFIGSIVLIILFLLFFMRSIKISSRAPDMFGGLAVIGIAILIIVESFMNISSMLGLIPLSGMPLLFVSHGGTALIMTLGAAGIIANISKHQTPQ
ncbi:MAG TPA: putative peptidoglycan glycosyltransferase FtsW [Candidatus Paceibacterota bacterium]